MPWKVIALIFCLIMGLQANAQLKTLNKNIDPDYIADFQEIASFRLSVAQRNFNFGLKSKIGDGKRIEYAPNVQGVYGFGLYYRKLGLELSMSLPSSDRENTLFGKTKFLDFQINSYGKEIGYDLNFQSYKGFYQANPKDFDNKWSVLGGYPQRPDVSALKLGMNVYYIFNNERFSYQAAFNQTERQLRSTGSFLLSSSFSYINIRSDSSLYPVPKPYTTKQGIAFEDGRFNILGFAPGYVYTFVINKDFYLSPSLFWGLAIRHQSYKIDDSRQSDLGIAQKVNFRLAAGYYGNRIFTGITLVTDNYRMNLNNILLNTATFNIKLFVGYRFSQLFGKDVQIDKLDELLSNGQ